MKADIYNQDGEIIDKAELPKSVFGLDINHDLIHQVAVSMMANQRRPWAHSKDRSERQGGGRKPWRQKGTGRSRHGSRRSPIWRKGGVTFGPRKERNYAQKINKKMRKQAILMMLSSKFADKELKIIDKLDINKTKQAAQILKSFKIKSCLIAQENKAFRNIPKTKTLAPQNLNALDLLNYKYLLLPKEGIEVIEKTWAKN
ncbi:MAG: 50S ribosomal protein L4 [bacterium]